MSKRPYEDLDFYFPYIADNAIHYQALNDYEVMVELGDGSAVIYDRVNKTIRNLPRDKDHMSDDECRSEFGYRLQSIMLHKHVSQRELSERTGITQAMLSRYIHGKASPSFCNLDKICRVLQCSMDELRYI